MTIFSHVTLGTNDIDRARRFYGPVMSALALLPKDAPPGQLIYGARSGPVLVIMTPFDGGAASVGNGTHVALNAASRSAVDAFHAAGVANGGTDEGPPGFRPHYAADYYAAYLRDPDGNKLQAVHRGPES